MLPLQTATRSRLRAADGEGGDEGFSWDDHPDEKAKLLDLNDQKGKVTQSMSTLENKYGDDSGELHTNLRAKTEEMNDDADSYESLSEEVEALDQAMEEVMDSIDAPYDGNDFLTNY